MCVPSADVTVSFLIFVLTDPTLKVNLKALLNQSIYSNRTGQPNVVGPAIMINDVTFTNPLEEFELTSREPSNELQDNEQTSSCRRRRQSISGAVSTADEEADEERVSYQDDKPTGSFVQWTTPQTRKRSCKTPVSGIVKYNDRFKYKQPRQTAVKKKTKKRNGTGDKQIDPEKSKKSEEVMEHLEFVVYLFARELLYVEWSMCDEWMGPQDRMRMVQTRNSRRQEIRQNPNGFMLRALERDEWVSRESEFPVDFNTLSKPDEELLMYLTYILYNEMMKD